jgi:hypothetical protein
MGDEVESLEKLARAVKQKNITDAAIARITGRPVERAIQENI